ncbi:hypothetical protein FIBSPDRAFT_961339 [Athelia psychrophila]|uniref:Uncharacterized protein n=1 Tax=Athelia psychrophila TaxID=1759441 RepID=A0A166BCP0_9AGAM|nr:hypothetical protein FIBSPDRAFT_961339 [Fibularhizoctonia sp. CBS 109695]
MATAVQRDIAKEAITETASQLSEVRQHSQRMTAHIGRLEDALEDALEGHRSIIAPIRGVTDDVLLEIFMVCFEDLVNVYHLKPFPISITLASVCRRWRALALSTPRLWSAASITVQNAPGVGRKSNLLHLFTSRSRERPLKLVVAPPKSQAFSDQEFDAGVCQPLAGALAACAARWEDISFGDDCSKSFLMLVQELIFAVTPGYLCPLPMLRSLGFERQYQDEDWLCLNMFAGAPNLRTVLYSICEMNFSKPHVDLVWDQLNTWLEAHLCVEGYMNLLRRCPALIQCWGGIVMGYYLGQRIYEGPILRHNLRSLEVMIREPGSGQNLFDHLELPCLLELYVSSETDTYDDEDAPAAEIWQQSSLEAFLLRSSCPLQRLVLDVHHFPMEGGLRLLEHLPELVEFGFSEPFSGGEPVFDTALVEKLTLSPDAGTLSSAASVLLPKLRVLALIGPLFCDRRAFRAMVKSRVATRNHAKLQALYLYPKNRDFTKVKNILRDKAHFLDFPSFPDFLRVEVSCW